MLSSCFFICFFYLAQIVQFSFSNLIFEHEYYHLDPFEVKNHEYYHNEPYEMMKQAPLERDREGISESDWEQLLIDVLRMGNDYYVGSDDLTPIEEVNVTIVSASPATTEESITSTPARMCCGDEGFQRKERTSENEMEIERNQQGLIILIVAVVVITLVAIVTLSVGLKWDGYGALVSLGAFVFFCLPLFVAAIILMNAEEDQNPERTAIGASNNNCRPC